MYQKITVGFVVQAFEDDGTPTDQSFVASDDVSYENEEGESIDPPKNDTYLPFDMVQPQ